MTDAHPIDILLWLSCPILLVQIALVIQGMVKLKSIDDVADKSSLPREGLSVVIAARDEAVGLPMALLRLREISGDWIEFIVVNDRSTDDTAAIVQTFCAVDPRFRLVKNIC